VEGTEDIARAINQNNMGLSIDLFRLSRHIGHKDSLSNVALFCAYQSFFSSVLMGFNWPYFCLMMGVK